MSQPIAETYVTIRGELAPGFEQDIKRKVQADVDRATADLKVQVGASRFSRLEKSGVVGAFQKNAALQSETRYTNELAAAQAAAAANQGRLSSAFSLGASRIGLYGLAISAVYSGTRRLAEQLAVTNDRANTLTGSLRNAGAAALRGDFAGFASQAGQSAALALQPGARGAANAAREATRLETEQKAAIALAAEYVRVKQAAAAATGQEGTAEGVVKHQLEEQLRILRLQVAALPKGQNRVAFAQLGLGPNGTNNQALIDRTKPAGSGRPTDLDFQLQAAKAQETKTAADDLELYRSRRSFLTGLVHRSEAAGADTVAAKTNLKRLYGLLADADSQVVALQKQSLEERRAKLMERIQLQQTELQIQEANARTDSQTITALRAEEALAAKLSHDKRLDAQSRANYALQAAQLDKQVFGINEAAAEQAKQAAEAAARQREEDRKEALAKLKAKREEAQQLKELRLQNAISAAGLTKRTTDDRKAIRAQISYYKDLVKNTRGLEREQARSQLIAARGSLQSLAQQEKGARGATTAEFFAKAAQQFGEFGSNIADRNGILSGQDARGAFAQIASGGISGAIAQGIAAAQKPVLSEAQKQTILLREIVAGVRVFYLPSGARERLAIQRARQKATHLGGV